jgi:hypothetical protein
MNGTIKSKRFLLPSYKQQSALNAAYVCYNFYSLVLEHSSEIHIFFTIVICEMGWQKKLTGYWLNGRGLTSG